MGRQEHLSVDPKFLRLTQSEYSAGFQAVDFENDGEAVRRAINGWVEERTKNKIKEVIGRGTISDKSGLILVNTIYIRADWSVAFPKGATRPVDFTIPGEPAFKVPMMQKVFQAGYTEAADFQLAKLAYKDNEVSMVVILPKKMDGLADVEKKLSAKALKQALAQLRQVELSVKMPKFKITEEFDVGSELAKMGIRAAFRKGIADFTGIQTDLLNPLYISAIAHRAFMDVNEEGAEAAAATVVRGYHGPLMMRFNPPLPVSFNADHPFLFFVLHEATGSVLFMGRISDPRGIMAPLPTQESNKSPGSSSDTGNLHAK